MPEPSGVVFISTFLLAFIPSILPNDFSIDFPSSVAMLWIFFIVFAIASFSVGAMISFGFGAGLGVGFFVGVVLGWTPG